jgi:hypothetical protein
MDKVEYTEAERWLIEPKPGTAAARARDFGVDLSLTVSNLRLTPHERVKRLDEFQHEMRLLREAVLSSKQHGRNRSGSKTVRWLQGRLRCCGRRRRRRPWLISDSDIGKIDILGEIQGVGSFEQCLEDSSELELFGIPCRVISLENLIAAKRSAGRPKDLLVLPELEAILEHQRQHKITKP